MAEMTTVSVYISTDLRNFAQEQAGKEGRSISNYIVRLLEREKEAHGQTPQVQATSQKAAHA